MSTDPLSSGTDRPLSTEGHTECSQLFAEYCKKLSPTASPSEFEVFTAGYDAAKPPSDGVRTAAFWSPCHRYLFTVFVTAADISVTDDNGVLYEAAGNEQIFADGNKTITPWVASAAQMIQDEATKPLHLEIERLRAALAKIAAGTPDECPPFRAMGPSQLRDIAIKALQERGL